MNADHAHPCPFEGYGSRFVSYCIDAGYESPVQQWAADRSNAAFTAWTAKKLQEWRAATGYEGGMADKQQAAFDSWLAIEGVSHV